jgi:hypothetical protein
MVKEAFGDKPADLQRFKEAVFSKFNLQYDENLIAIFKQRVNAKTIPNIANSYKSNLEQGKDNTAIILTASDTSASSLSSFDISFFDIPAFVNKVLGGACEGAREGVRP